MIYPNNFEQKSGFDTIRKMVLGHCLSSIGRHYAENMTFSASYEKINILLDQTDEMRQIIISGEQFPGTNYFDSLPMLERLKLEGTFAEPDELGDFRLSYSTVGDIVKFLQKTTGDNRLKYPVLHRLTDGIEVQDLILKEINRILEPTNEIRSKASAGLASIREAKSRLEIQANRRISQIFNQAKKDGLVASDAELALRNNRQVIPIPAGFKRKIKGFVHDQSSTGQTVFLEPEEIFEINNEIRQLELDERQEIIRILKAFADFIRPYIPQLKISYQFLGKIDFIRAKALTAAEMQAMKPKISSTPVINWIRAKHPLLLLAHKAQKKHVEPLTIELNQKDHIIVISGPNAGGKSVCLKTIGLLQYMIQCGMLVPMEDYSDVGIFEHIFIDIGDEQSIENDLSTYSSHLANMRLFLDKATANTLFLIDEFGAGTEPGIGGAIAEAILQELTFRKAFGVITTHYANLKIMAGKTPGIVNGSMLFDTQNMRPLFKLKTGTPGSSFAFEIARNMGLPEKVLEIAGQIAGTDKVDFDQQLQDMELKKLELEEKEKQLNAADSFLAEMIDKYEKLNHELNRDKSIIINNARKDAQKILTETNKKIENTIREIKQAGAEKEKTRLLRDELDAYNRDIENQIESLPDETRASKKKKQNRPIDNEKVEIQPGPIVVGDSVRVKGQENIGEVISLSEKDASVAYGSIIMKVKISNLERLKRDAIRKENMRITVKYDFDISEKAAEFSPNLDIRGQRAEEALIKARRFVDDAILLGTKQLKIVHGTGDGILREALRDYLSTLPEVKRARDEHPDRGGAGSTTIELK